MLKWLIKFYSYFPVLSLTDDNNFGTNDLRKLKDEQYKPSYRFSLLNLILGHIAVYVITYNITDKKFSLFQAISIENCGSLKSDYNEAAINERVGRYINNHLNALSDKDSDTELEFIKYLNDGQCERVALSERKISLYSTILLALIPILLTAFDIKVFLAYAWYEKLLTIIIIYSLLNVTLIIFRSMKVKGYSFSTFSSLRNSGEKKTQLIKNHYNDWQVNRGSAITWVSYVLNVENWIKVGLITAILLTLLTNCRYVTNQIISDNKPKNIGEVLTLDMNEFANIYSDSRISFVDLQLKAQKKW